MFPQRRDGGLAERISTPSGDPCVRGERPPGTTRALKGTENLNFVVPINYARGLLNTSELLTLPQLTTRLQAASSDLFGTLKPSFPARWKSLTSGTVKLVRVEADHIYVETVLSPEQKQNQVFYLADLAKKGDKWVGVMRGGGICYTDWNRTQNFGRDEFPAEITLLTPTRIEGSTQAFPPGSKFNCAKCKTSGKPELQRFTWIPEEQ